MAHASEVQLGKSADVPGAHLVLANFDCPHRAVWGSSALLHLSLTLHQASLGVFNCDDRVAKN